jgi:hypothetical protein
MFLLMYVKRKKSTTYVMLTCIIHEIIMIIHAKYWLLDNYINIA